MRAARVIGGFLCKSNGNFGPHPMSGRQMCVQSIAYHEMLTFPANALESNGDVRRRLIGAHAGLATHVLAGGRHGRFRGG